MFFLSDIVLAINLSASHMIPATANWYGKIIEQQGKRFHINPLLIVSVITHESQWNAGLVSSDGLDYGLMQVRSKYCKAPPDHLLNPITNIQIGTALLKTNYNFCEKTLKREPEIKEFMTCYAASCWPPKKACRVTNVATTFEKHAACLEQAIEERISLDCNKIYWDHN